MRLHFLTVLVATFIATAVSAQAMSYLPSTAITTGDARDVTVTSATLVGTVTSSATGYTFQYRQTGATDWTQVDQTLTQLSNFTGEVTRSITGLSPNTGYEYRIYGSYLYCPGADSCVDSTIDNGEVKTFTTLENSYDTCMALSPECGWTGSVGQPPDTTPPTISITLSRIRLTRTNQVLAQISSNEATPGLITTAIKIRSRAGKLAKKITLQPARIRLDGKLPSQAKFSLALSVRKKLMSYLRSGKIAEVAVTAVVTDASRNKRTASKTAKVTL